jgi:3-hydroxyisobutyrate dehydrogenase-like beta-hydroxyacid dehydrogenase
MDHTSSDQVTVLGCGLMGSAIASALARTGHRVVVWNRSPDKARALEGPGVRAADTAGDAVADAAVVVIAVLLDYDVLRQVLADGADVRGKLVVNLATGSPGQAAEMRDHVHGLGATYLDGAILAYPQNIGAPDCLVVYAGPADAFATHLGVFRAIGGAAQHVSEDIGGANVLDGGLTGGFYLPSLVAFVEATAYAHRHGVGADALRATATSILGTLAEQVEHVVAGITAGVHQTDQATVQVYAEAGRSWQGAMQDAGQHPRLLAAANEVLAVAREAGLDDLGMSAVAQVAGREHPAQP